MSRWIFNILRCLAFQNQGFTEFPRVLFAPTSRSKSCSAYKYAYINGSVNVFGQKNTNPIVKTAAGNFKSDFFWKLQGVDSSNKGVVCSNIQFCSCYNESNYVKLPQNTPKWPYVIITTAKYHHLDDNPAEKCNFQGVVCSNKGVVCSNICVSLKLLCK